MKRSLIRPHVVLCSNTHCNQEIDVKNTKILMITNECFIMKCSNCYQTHRYYYNGWDDELNVNSEYYQILKIYLHQHWDITFTNAI